ncbi:MAG: hypothetical protein V4732_21970 [Pseudomonadota bacterium]
MKTKPYKIKYYYGMDKRPKNSTIQIEEYPNAGNDVYGEIVLNIEGDKQEFFIKKEPEKIPTNAGVDLSATSRYSLILKGTKNEHALTFIREGNNFIYLINHIHGARDFANTLNHKSGVGGGSTTQSM